MASNNIIFAVPTANTSVDYTLPESDSAKLSFSPEDIDGLKLDPNGGLIISFVEGGSVTISNFQSFIDNGNTLSLADGTQVDPKLLFNALGGQNDNPFPASDAVSIGIPADNSTREITLESGKKYVLNFDLSETQGADVKDGHMTISFANGGKIVINNYEEAMAAKLPPELSLASKTCVVTGDELITNIKALAAAGTTPEQVVVIEEEEAPKRHSKLANADMEGNDNIGPGDETALGYKAAHTEGKGDDDSAANAAKIAPAAGDDKGTPAEMAEIARELAEIETAAGGAAGGARNSGYGYNSRPGSDPFTTNPDIGPIDPTALNYVAPIVTPNPILLVNTDPIAVGPNTQTLDETNLSIGPVSKSGTININYGSDGPGGINPDGNFSSDGSKTGGVLSHNGVPITVTSDANTYVGMAGGVKVFELQIDPVTGNYTFTQYENLDHANGTDPNDAIGLHFGIIAHDGDGDSISTSVNIIILDDAPSITGTEKTVDETDLGPLVETGNLVHNFGQDGAGTITTAGTFSFAGSTENGVLSSNGHAISVTATSTGYTGTANGVVVFTLTLTANGAYTYTQYANLDHADNNNPNDIIKLTFGAEITDRDGDVATAPIVINVKDDAPRFEDCGCHPDDPNPTPGDVVEIVDETNLGPIVETGRLVVNYGADAPGSMAFKDGGFTAGGSLKGDALTHNGVPVTVSIVNGNYVGMAGNVTVFTLELDKATGDYKFTLLDNLDHKDGTNPDDIISLKFGVTASDSEGDSVDGSITINVKDDAPIAHDDVNSYDTSLGIANGNVISGLNGGAGAADVLSQDENTTVVKISFDGHEVDVPATGTVSIDGQYGTLTIAADGTYSYTAFDQSNMTTPPTEKHFTVGPDLPDFDYEPLDTNEEKSIGIAPGNLSVQAGDIVQVNFSKEQGDNHNSLGIFTVDADGNLKMEKVLVKDTETANAETFSYVTPEGAKDIGFFLVTGGNKIDPAYANLDFSKGSLDFIFDYGKPTERPAKATDDGAHVKLVYTAEDGTETAIKGPIYFTSERGEADTLNTDGAHVVSGVKDGDDTVLHIGFEDYKDHDFNDVQFDVSIVHTGCGCGKDDIKDQFEYTIKDGDGDTDKATLDLNGKDLTDTQPVFTPIGAEFVDETNLATGVITETGTIVVNFGSDGPGFIGAAGTFTSDGSRTGNALTSNGVAVVVTLLGDVYTGKAGDVTVFSLKINADGTYEFKQFEQLDHADGTNANDAINLNFGIMATDCDGDVSKSTLTVKVLDDAPTITGGSGTVDETNLSAATPLVVAGTLAHSYGQDGAGSIAIGSAADFAAGGSLKGGALTSNGSAITVTATADGYVGKTADGGVAFTLTINTATGAYEYKQFKNLDHADASNPNDEITLKFDAKITDFDGDSAKAPIVITVRDDAPSFPPENPDNPPEDPENPNNPNDPNDPAMGNGYRIVDETNLTPAGLTTTGHLNADFGADAPGSYAATGSFTSTGSKTNNALTSNGVPVVVTLEGGNYVGKAGGVVVFTLSVNTTTGDYTFVLKDTLDHANGSNPNDIINLNFGIVAKDSEGDSVNGTIRIDVKDDAPVANDDTLNVAEGASVTSNVTNNDAPGQDLPGTVTKVVFNGTTFTVPETGTVSIPGTYGTLVIDHTGAYTYTAKSNVASDGTDNFTYTLKDYDGDTDTAVLSLNVKEHDDAPIIIKPADEIVDETNLSTGVITETGSVTADFLNDGPGTFAANGVFSSSGSQTGDALTHNGVAVTVTTTGNVYTGTAGGVTIFTLTVEADGSYSFKLYENLDHKDGTNADDIINLHFGIKATDADGDSAATTLTVQVKDDAPTISGGSGTVDETDLSPAAPLVVGGTLAHNYGQDGAGSIVIGSAADFAAGGSLKGGTLSSGGVPVTVTATATGYVGTAGGVTVFTLTINTATGAYEYKQFKGLDHADATNPNDEITLKFDAKIVDFDGDSAKAPIVITVRDDAPSFPPENPDNPEDPTNPGHPVADNGYRIVDETSLTPAGLTTTGKLNADFGADAPGSYAPTGSFTSTGSKTGGNLTSNGVPVIVTLENGQYVGKAGSTVVFTLNVNPTTGDYTFVLKDTLDHADGTNPNDVISLNFGIGAKDSEGDTVTGTVRIDVKDDAPVANDDTVNVSEGRTAIGNVTNNDVPGNDLPATVTKVVFNGTTYTVPETGSLTIIGTYGTLAINATGAYTYVAKTGITHDGQDDFTYTLRDRDGDTDPAVLSVCVADGNDIPEIIKPAVETVDETNLSGGVITETGAVTANFFGDGPGVFAANNSFTSDGSRLGGALTHEGVPVTVSNVGNVYTGTAGGVTIFTMTIQPDGTYSFNLYEQLDHADGSDANDIINLHFGVKATDADGDSAATTVTVQVKDDAPIANDDTTNVNEGGVATGNVKNNDVGGQDVVANVTKVVFNGTSYTVPDSGTVTIVGTYGTLVIGKTGEYTYTAKGNVASDGQDDFTYTLKDHDGDVDTAVLSLCVKDNDDTPVVVKPADNIVDETNLSGGAITTGGTISANFFNDGPGSIGGNGSFTSSGSRLGNALTSNGVAVNVTFSGNTYTGKAGDVTIFTLTIAANGTYTFKLLEQLDHANGNDANDIINLNFGVKATDADGDVGNSTVTVQVKDDAPVGQPNYCTIYISNGSFSSNALTNDVIGQDAPGRLTQVTFGTHTVDIPASGTASIAGLYGMLTIAANGTYTYHVTNPDAPTASENFTLKTTDYDGDSSTSLLQMNLIGDDLQGTESIDTIYLSSGNDLMHGNGGDDNIYGRGGDDTLYGDAGKDYIDGGIGNDKIYGGSELDNLYGREGNDTIYGGDGNDNIYGDGGTADTYIGNDTLYGEAGTDYIFGGAGADYIDGGADNDTLYGGDGNDTIIGGTGNDAIIGQKGNDTLTGGAGADTFWYLAVDEGVDHIKDFSVGQGDKLNLANVITNFDPLTDAINNFVFATHDANGNTTILVNNAGTGIAGATALAVLDGVNVSVSDLFNSGAILH